MQQETSIGIKISSADRPQHAAFVDACHEYNGRKTEQAHDNNEWQKEK